MVLIPLGFNLLVWLAEPMLARFWTGAFAFWMPRLGLAGGVSLTAVPPFWLGLDLPVFSLPSSSPGPWAWWGSVAAAAGLLWLSCHTSDRFMPLRYLLRFVVFIHVAALVYFGTYPASFPYTVPLYLESSFAIGLWFMAVLPWVHGLVYHVFGFPLMNKVALTLLSLLFLAVAIPLQLLAHAFILTQGSLLYLPVLHLVFGILPLVLGCIGLYGWAMSWRGKERGGVGSENDKGNPQVAPMWTGRP